MSGLKSGGMHRDLTIVPSHFLIHLIAWRSCRNLNQVEPSKLQGRAIHPLSSAIRPQFASTLTICGSRPRPFYADRSGEEQSVNLSFKMTSRYLQ